MLSWNQARILRCMMFITHNNVDFEIEIPGIHFQYQNNAQYLQKMDIIEYLTAIIGTVHNIRYGEQT
jgi:hypothetical protein